MLPRGWEDRLVKVSNPNTAGPTGYCLKRHDLCLSKLAAAREKDFAFVGALLDADLVNIDVLGERVDQMDTADARTRQANPPLRLVVEGPAGCRTVSRRARRLPRRPKRPVRSGAARCRRTRRATAPNRAACRELAVSVTALAPRPNSTSETTRTSRNAWATIRSAHDGARGR